MNTKTIITVLLVSLFLVSCTSLANFIPVTPTVCYETQNPGPVPPEVENRAQDAFLEMERMGMRGTLKLDAIGEYGCGPFAVQQIDFQYTLYVTDLEDQATIKEYVSRAKQSAKESVKGWNLGFVTVRFVTGKECIWYESQNACTPIGPLTFP